MATGKGLVCKLGQHIPIEGADRIVQVNMFGETIITQKTNEEGTLGILFDMETCLSHKFASNNNMYRHSQLNVDKSITGYLEDDRRIRPIKLKGVKVSGLFMPIESLYFISNTPEDVLSVGLELDTFDNVQICEKYISKATRKGMSQNKGGRVKQNLCPTFREHIDTDQWGRNQHKVQKDNLVIITEKLHGTSGRCGYLPIHRPLNKFQKFIAKVFKYIFKFNLRSENLTSYEFVVGSRRVVKSIGGNEAENKSHFYEEDLWTKISKECFEGKIKKGETVYFEIVGYTPSGELIMPSVSNKKLEKFLDKKEYKKFIDKYGDITTFNYGCNNNLNQHILEESKQNFYKVFVYRITMTNEDGDSIDYSWEQVKNRCDQLDVNYTPELAKYLINDGERFDTKENCNEVGTPLNKCVEYFTNEDSKEFPQHVREGVCIRIENGGMTPILLKNKSFIFKVLEGIVKDTDVVDIEESN